MIEEPLLRRMKMMVYGLVLAALFFVIIIVARDVLIPVSLAFLFATLLYPVTVFFMRFRIPGPLAILLSILMLIGAILVAIIIYVNQIQGLIADFPTLRMKALANLEYFRLAIEENFGIDSASQYEWLSGQISRLFESGSDFLKNTVNATAGTVFKLLLIPVLVFYMLNSRERFRQFILMLAPSGKKDWASNIMTQVSVTIQRYLTGVFTVIMILCVLNSLGLYIVGLKFALIFGITSAFFNFIPYFGNWIGAILPLTFALLSGDSPRLFFSVLLMYIIIQFVEHNILTPNITGGYARINPLTTIVGIIIAGMVWGVAGMLVVIPFIATIKIIFENIEKLKPYAHLMGSDENAHQGLIRRVKKLFNKSRD